MSHITNIIHSKYDNNKFLVKVIEFSTEHYYEVEIIFANGWVVKCPKGKEAPLFSKEEENIIR